jgi:LuxR family maltose regulon positive regulatory protein
MSGETHDREPSVLLATKLYVPALRDRLIGRAWLVQGLSAGNVRELTLLSAPAGWGKTTLHAQWVDSEKEHVRFAWLSSDRTDNDPVRFWTYVVAALRQAQPAVAQRASDLLARGADLEESVLPTLLNELADLDAGSELILDDYHLVTNLTKELEVLRLLAMPMSRREIADRLYVSLNTVKTHQRGLHRKLGVADRTQAVKRGRELGIL